MRTVLVVILIAICLGVIVGAAFLPVSLAEPEVGRLSRDARRSPLDLPIWMRWNPFGVRLQGWQGVISAVASWVYLYLTSVLVLVLVPRRVRTVTHTLSAAGWAGLARMEAIGLLALVLSGLLVLLARYAFVGSLLVIILIGAVLMLSYLGLVSLSLSLGALIRRWARMELSPWSELALGTLILFALDRIPIAGWLSTGLAAALGLGAVLATHLGSGQSWSLQELNDVE